MDDHGQVNLGTGKDAGLVIAARCQRPTGIGSVVVDDDGNVSESTSSSSSNKNIGTGSDDSRTGTSRQQVMVRTATDESYECIVGLLDTSVNPLAAPDHLCDARRAVNLFYRL